MLLPSCNPMNFAVRLPTPDGRHAGRCTSPRGARQPASLRTAYGRLSWLRQPADQLVDSARSAVDRADCQAPQPTHTRRAVWYCSRGTQRRGITRRPTFPVRAE